MNTKTIQSGAALIGLALSTGSLAFLTPAAAQTPAQHTAIHNSGVEAKRAAQKAEYESQQRTKLANHQKQAVHNAGVEAQRAAQHQKQAVHNAGVEAKRAAQKAEYESQQRTKLANHQKQAAHNATVEAQRAAQKAAYYKAHPKK